MDTLRPDLAEINPPPAQTYAEVLTASRTYRHRGLYWTPHAVSDGCPCCGTLEITKGKKGTRYSLTEFPVGRGYGAGRAFELVKDDGTVYHLFLADDRPHATCDCPGFSYASTAKANRRHGDQFETLGCCHLDAVDSLSWNRWLPDPRENAEADTGPTEVPEQPERFETLPSGYVRQKGYETAEQTVF